jgi:hypothetical protein
VDRIALNEGPSVDTFNKAVHDKLALLPPLPMSLHPDLAIFVAGVLVGVAATLVALAVPDFVRSVRSTASRYRRR